MFSNQPQGWVWHNLVAPYYLSRVEKPEIFEQPATPERKRIRAKKGYLLALDVERSWQAGKLEWMGGGPFSTATGEDVLIDVDSLRIDVGVVLRKARRYGKSPDPACESPDHELWRVAEIFEPGQAPDDRWRGLSALTGVPVMRLELTSNPADFEITIPNGFSIVTGI